ncbi:MAG: peptide deformylase [Candidatus Omnitrophica bacterium]|nr:peptide deformylase [Candidatus Omnitrophota bacterium]
MEQLELKTYPDPCLRIKTKPVEQFDKDLDKILRVMADIMYVNQGIGLAAPQVGLGLSIFVMDTGSGLVNFINPQIIEVSDHKTSMEEGCLSLPGVLVNVSRPANVKVRAQDARGEFFIKRLDALEAKAVQHEIDHLAGKLIIDYLDPVRHFIAKFKLSTHKRKQHIKTCEVICHVGKKDNGRPGRGAEGKR